MPAADKSDINFHTIRLGIALILLAATFVVILSLARIGPFITIQVKEGISVFAVAYLMAQLLERAVEPFSEMNAGEKKGKKKPEQAKLFSDTDRIKALRKNGSNKQNPELDKLVTKRVIAFWGLTSFLGILLCYVSIGLFEIAGVYFQPLAVAGRSITGHTVDSIFSGMIVGGGTKPLHDFIGYLQKSSTAKSS